MKNMYPCETFSRNVLPLFRGLVAKELIEKYNYTQLEASKKLGTTQASISYYINFKRGHKNKKQFEDILPTIETIAFETAKNIAQEKIGLDEVVEHFCKLCTLLREDRNLPETTSKDSSNSVF